MLNKYIAHLQAVKQVVGNPVVAAMNQEELAQINKALLEAQNQRAIATARMAQSSHGQKGSVMVGIRYQPDLLLVENKIAVYDSYFDEMDKDKNGKISKEEWLKAVEALFQAAWM